MSYEDMIACDNYVREDKQRRKRIRRWFDGRKVDREGRMMLPECKPEPKPKTPSKTNATTKQKATGRSKYLPTSCVRSRRYIGVTKASGQVKIGFRARVWVPILGERHIGTYPTREDAARAFDVESFRLYGPNARLNYPEEYAGREWVGTEEAVGSYTSGVSGETNHKAKTNEADVRLMRQCASEGIGYVELGLRFGISDVQVGKIVRGEAWGHVV